MRKDLLALPWLTAEQALVALKDLLGYEILLEDLISQCQYNQCEVFVLTGDTQGTSSTVLPLGETEWTIKCCAAGPQRVLNPEALIAAKNRVKLCLSGAVFTVEEDEPRKYQPIEWEVDIGLEECVVQFQTSKIQDLAGLITALNKPLDPRERKSMLRIIAVLASMAGIDLSKPYTPYEAIAQKAAEIGVEVGNDDTVAKYLEAAAEVC